MLLQKTFSNLRELMEFVIDRVENAVGKWVNTRKVFNKAPLCQGRQLVKCICREKQYLFLFLVWPNYCEVQESHSQQFSLIKNFRRICMHWLLTYFVALIQNELWVICDW